MKRLFVALFALALVLGTSAPAAACTPIDPGYPALCG
jgi:hypothetical protein